MIVCKNCGLDFQGKFCPACGQKAKTKRITLMHVLQETRQHFIHFDQGFLYTIKELAIRPGHSIRGYLEGRRVKHIKPLKFLFWTLALSFLLVHYMGIDQVFTQQLNQQQTGTAHSQLLTQKLMLLLTSHPTALIFTLIPFFALFSWLLFRRGPYNYAEHFVFSAYLMGELSLFSLLITPMAGLFGDLQEATTALSGISFLVWIVYFAWAYRQFFQSNNWRIPVKGTVSLVLGYLLMIIFTGLIISLIVALFGPQLEAWLQN